MDHAELTWYSVTHGDEYRMCPSEIEDKSNRKYSAANAIRGFVKLKKFQKSEKNPEVGGWVKPQLGFNFFLEMLCFLCFLCVVFMFPRKKQWIGGWVVMV